MDNKVNANSKMKKYKVTIIILSVLLAISLVLLAVQFVRKVIASSDKVTLSNNSIGAIEKNWTFGGENVLPGDSISKEYPVVISHKNDVALSFTAVVKSDSEVPLASVLNVRIENATSGKVICEGKLSEINGKAFTESIAHSGSGETSLTYKITVTMDTSAGNEYQRSSIEMGFRWSILAGGKEGAAK